VVQNRWSLWDSLYKCVGNPRNIICNAYDVITGFILIFCTVNLIGWSFYYSLKNERIDVFHWYIYHFVHIELTRPSNGTSTENTNTLVYTLNFEAIEQASRVKSILPQTRLVDKTNVHTLNTVIMYTLEFQAL